MSSRRELAPFAALSASYFAHIGFFNPYLPLWLKDLGLSLLVIGMLATLQSLTRVVAPYAWGWLSDHSGERVKLLRYGATAALFFSAGLWLDLADWGVAGLAVVLLLMFGHTSAMMPMSEAAMAHLVSRSGGFDAKRYGRVRLWGSVGFLLTVLLAGAWFEAFGLHDFPLWTTLSLLAVTLSVWAMPDIRETVAAHQEKLSVWPVLRQRRVQWFFAALFFHVLSHMGIYVFFSLYLDELGMSKTVIGVLWALAVLAEIAWFFSQSRWLPKFSLSAWLLLCSLVMVLRMGITASSVSLLPLLLAQCLHAMTFANHHVVCITLLSEYFPGRLRGRGQALYTVIGYGVPGVLGGLGGALLSSTLGLASIFWACMAISLIAVACSYRLWRLRS
ncbi:MAG: MFS transporter [Burkholderiaceae bacterium]